MRRLFKVMSSGNPTEGKARHVGKVIKWFDGRGFGFAILDNQKIFLHVSKFDGHVVGDSVKVRIGSIIEARIARAVKGKQAFEIKIIEY